MDIKVLKEFYTKQLMGPKDDYWAHGIIENKEHLLIKEDGYEGYVAIEDGVIYEFYMHGTPEKFRSNILNQIIERYSIKEIIAPTYDSVLYKMLSATYNSVIVSLCYVGFQDEKCKILNAHLVNESTMSILLDYTEKVLGGKRSEHVNYYNMLLKVDGVYLFYLDDLLIGTGELRHYDNNAFLGMTVDPKYRNKGYGACILNHMKHIAYDRDLTPLCGVDTDNIPSIKAIEKAGFKQTHQIHKFLIKSSCYMSIKFI